MNVARETDLLLSALAHAGMPAMLVGAVALDALGVPRTTMDVDLQIASMKALSRSGRSCPAAS